MKAHERTVQQMPSQMMSSASLSDVGQKGNCYLAILDSPMEGRGWSRSLSLAGRFPAGDADNRIILVSAEDMSVDEERRLDELVERGAHVLWDERGLHDGIALFSSEEIFVNDMDVISLALDKMDSGRWFEPIIETHCLYIMTSLLDQYMLYPIEKAQDNFEFCPASDVDSYKLSVEVLSCGHRKLIEPSIIFDIGNNRRSIITNYPYAREIAKRGAAGKRAKEMLELCDDLMDCRRIWTAFAECGGETIGESDGVYHRDMEKMREIGTQMGVDGFIESLLVDGVPLEDILA